MPSTSIAAALAPVFLLIILGHTLRRLGFVPDSFWQGAERTTYFILFPCLLFLNLARAELAFGEAAPMAAAMSGAVLAVTAAAVLARPLWPIGGPQFAVVLQGAIRPNVYVGLAAGSALFGAQGVALSALCIAAVIPLVNALSVLVLARWGSGHAPGPLGVLMEIVRNPLILACAAGFAVNLAGLPLPPILTPTAEILSRAALPLGLLAVGAGLQPAMLRRIPTPMAAAVAGKLVLTPAVTLGLAMAAGVSGEALAMAVLFNALPVSASAYVMTRQMGGDAQLMAGVITATTIAAAVTLPVMLVLVTVMAGSLAPAG